MTEPLKAVEADATAAPEGSTVILTTDDGEATVLIPPPGRWKTRANRALRESDFDGWAQIVLSPEDYQAWADLDPTNDDVEAFFTTWKQVSGDDPKRSGRSTPSSKPTPRR